MSKFNIRSHHRSYAVLKLLKKVLVAKYPRSIAAQNLKFRARNPKSINQKILWKMAFDNREYQTIFADKYKVREYVTGRVGPQYLTKIFHVGAQGEPIPWSKLPIEFVMKCNHSSGGSVIIFNDLQKNSLPRRLDSLNWGKYLVHPENIEKEKIQHFFNKLLTQNYADFPGFREFAYFEIPPKLIIEELLKNENGDLPNDIKFWCINGRVELVQVDVSRFANHQRLLLDRNWKKIPVRITYPIPTDDISAPRNLQEMIKVSELLANGVDFVRVDLYDLGDRIVFGELTNYPGGGLEKFDPSEIGLHLGSLLKLQS